MDDWQFFIDRGGTFTDCLGVGPDGTRKAIKVLSSDDAPLLAIRQLLKLDEETPIPSCEVRVGTTLATNALLERKGARTLLVITRGFADLLEIGTQARPAIFALDIKKPEVLYERVIESCARAKPDGEVACETVALETEREAVLSALREARSSGLESVAVVVLNGHVAAPLERDLEQGARAAGFSHVSMSHECANEVGLLARAQTTVLDAYLTPRLTTYFRHLQQRAPAARMLAMQSSGSLVAPAELRGPHSLLSGPAGGVVACEHLTRVLELGSAIGLDMGGTSTDVCRVEAGDYPLRYETTIAGVSVIAPTMDIHTVAAGGGSICEYDGARFQVGPHSAGADPGPACYGAAHARSLTVTDVNLLLGRLIEDYFPFPLQRAAAERCLTELLGRVHQSGNAADREQALSGWLRIANYTMAEAIREVSLRRGFDVRADTLIVFGGAGGQHACALARELGIKTVVFPMYGGILSACGMACARQARHRQMDARSLLLVPDNMTQIARHLNGLVEPVLAPSASATLLRIDLRYRGGDARLTLDWNDNYSNLIDAFHDAHARRFGYCRPDDPVEVVTLRAEVIEDGPLTSPFEEPKARDIHQKPTPYRQARMLSGSGRSHEVPVYRRDELAEGHVLPGPACLVEATGCIIVEPGFQLTVQRGHLVCRDLGEDLPFETTATSPENGAQPDPVTLELMGQAFMSLARQMGSVLQRTAMSTNIRERLDFSCAVFDAKANLIANAPHIPVHLGAMGETVRHVSSIHTGARPGDVFASNDPRYGGSHLPDITVVTPVFDQQGQRLRYWVANRGHHSDVGGITPGSMPAFSSSLAQEGIVLTAVKVVHDGRFCREELVQLLSSGPYPARDPQQNIADLQAQVAANHLGVNQLHELEVRFGADTVQSYMAHLQDYAAALTLDLIRGLPQRPHTFRDQLDDGTPIGAVVTPRGPRLQVRFEYTPESSTNANAPRAVSVAALLYVLRCLLGTRLPLNAGCLRPIDLQIPSPSLLDPGPERAVSSGNVETSQRVVDVLLGCLGAAAASQGTMNNVAFGDASFGYYETVAGGAGAGPSFSGASGVHTHMTNTRITDPEIVEARYPVTITRFALRRNSGGRGAQPGGDGCIREYRFLRPLSVSLVTERRTIAPFGLARGEPGRPGVNRLNGELLPSRCEFTVAAGDVLCIETPGGGGWGNPHGET